MYYKKYCKIFSKVVLAAKRMHFNKIIQNSENKIKISWTIINEAKGKFKDSQNMKFLRINPSAWSDGHCPHTVNITCRGVTGTARIQ